MMECWVYCTHDSITPIFQTPSLRVSSGEWQDHKPQQTEAGGVAEVGQADDHSLVPFFGLGAVGTEQAVPEWKG